MSEEKGAEATKSPLTEHHTNGSTDEKHTPLTEQHTNGSTEEKQKAATAVCPEETPAKTSGSGQMKRQAQSPAKSPSRAANKKPNSGGIKNTILNYFKRSPEKKASSKRTGDVTSSGKIVRKTKQGFSRTRCDDDTMEYRKGYPSRPVKERPNLKDNLLFYTNEIPSQPRGGYIDEILEDWWGNYKLLESHHGYIQWLFPIRESGMNMMSQELQPHEAEGIKSDPEAQARVIKAYRLMLDFYGMNLKDHQSGEIERSENWRPRFHNLNENRHNFLRITRILKSLGELGQEHLKAPFVKFILQEALEERSLLPTLDAALDYWLYTIKDDQQRQDLMDYAYQFIEEV